MFQNTFYSNSYNSQNFPLCNNAKAVNYEKKSEDQSTYSIASQESTQFSDNNSQGSDENIKHHNPQNAKKESFKNYQTQNDQINFQNKPQMVLEYASDIFSYLRSNEDKFMPNSNYLQNTQRDINEHMRAILIDWLVDVHQKFKLLPETLFLAVNVVDRYLGKVQISRKILQLVGVTALLIACKYEEVYAPELNEFSHLTDYVFSVKDILSMEGDILCALQFDLTSTSSHRFLERYAYICNFDSKSFNLAKYILELALLEYNCIQYNPSLLASCAMYLTMNFNKLFDEWPEIMIESTLYSESDLVSCSTDFLKVLKNVGGPRSLNAVRRKFSHINYNEVSKLKLQ